MLLDRIGVGSLVGLRDRALVSVMVFSFAAGERGRGDAARGLLPAGDPGVAAAAREGRPAPRRAGPPPGRGGARGVRLGRRRRGPEGAAVPRASTAGAGRAGGRSAGGPRWRWSSGGRRPPGCRRRPAATRFGRRGITAYPATPPTGVPNRPSGPPSSSARCAAATAPARAPTRTPAAPRVGRHRPNDGFDAGPVSAAPAATRSPDGPAVAIEPRRPSPPRRQRRAQRVNGSFGPTAFVPRVRVIERSCDEPHRRGRCGDRIRPQPQGLPKRATAGAS